MLEEAFTRLHCPTSTHRGWGETWEHHLCLTTEAQLEAGDKGVLGVDNRGHPGRAQGRVGCCRGQEKITRISALCLTLMLDIGPNGYQKLYLPQGALCLQQTHQRIPSTVFFHGSWDAVGNSFGMAPLPCSMFMVTQPSFCGVRLFTKKYLGQDWAALCFSIAHLESGDLVPR